MPSGPDDIAKMLQEAFGLHQQGQLEQAEARYRQILDRDAANFPALQLLGALRGQQGRHTEALSLIEAALKIRPNDMGAHSNYGLALAAAGRHGDAVATYDRALSINPKFFQAHYNRGISLASLQRFEDAVGSFDKALAIRPESVESFYNKALALTALNRLQSALENYDSALARNPKLAEAHHNYGNVLRDLGRLDEALEKYDRALALSPRDFRTLYNRGIALSELKRPKDAIASFDASLDLNPEFPEAWFNRGISQMALDRFAEALASFDRGLLLRPDDVKALSDRAAALRQLGRSDEALASCNQALASNPDHVPTLMLRGLLLQEAARLAESLADYDRVLKIDAGNALAWNGRGATLYAMKRDDDALASFERAVNVNPDLAEALTNCAHLRWTLKGDYAAAVKALTHSIAVDPHQPYVQGELLHMKMQVADWTGFDREIALIDAGVREGRRVVRPFVYQALSQSPADLQACSRILAASLFSDQTASPRIYEKRHRKIKIGYLSGEFREQATAYLMAGLYECHDRDRFEIIAVDNGGPDASAMRKRLDAAFDSFIDISKLADGDAADRIRAAEIDILVNLNGYFGSPRMGVFARRPAPVQVNYLGFPATLGATYIDYILADPIVIPQGERRFYDEQVVWLPHSYQANDSKRPIAENIPTRAALGLPENAFVFCNFNQSYKLTPQTFSSWMRILKEVDGSVLWLLESKPPFAENLMQAAECHGVARERLIFAPPILADLHLARLKQADLFLDTLPYNAHTTASDALWAGLPLLTCRGSAFPGRVAASLLHAIGLPELVTDTLDQYEALACKLALDTSLHASIKKKLMDNRLTTPLFDTDRFRRDIEAAYTQMWELAERGESPRGFRV